MLRRALLAAPWAALLKPSLAADRLEAFGLRWSVPLLSDWNVATEEGEPVLRLVTARPLPKEPRRPFQYALAETPAHAKVSLELDVRREPRVGSLILIYAWQDPAHFNYAHLSNDSATEQPVHNGIFHVYGGDRVRISSDKGPGSLHTGGWHHVRLDYDAATGAVEVAVDGATNPSLRAVDVSLGAGLTGVGSFFNTGAFRRIKITGNGQT